MSSDGPLTRSPSPILLVLYVPSRPLACLFLERAETSGIRRSDNSPLVAPEFYSGISLFRYLEDTGGRFLGALGTSSQGRKGAELVNSLVNSG